MSAGETTISITGNLTADPELRFTASGAAVANFTVASTPRTYKNGQWEDGETLFLKVNVWRQQAENVAESLTRGSRVTVVGALKQRSFETKEGEKRTVIEVEASDVSASLQFATVRVQRHAKADGGGQGQSRPSSNSGGGDPWGGDPWGAAPKAAVGGYSSEPPF